MTDLKEITKLNKEEAMSLHKQMWQLLYDNVVEHDKFPDKAAAIKSMGYQPYSIVNQCFCCHYAHLRLQPLVKQGVLSKNETTYTEWMCSQCPFKMSHTVVCSPHTAPCMRMDAVYYQLVTRKVTGSDKVPEESYHFVRQQTEKMMCLPERKLTPLKEVTSWKS